MAQKPARVVWSDSAFESFQQLSVRERERLLDRIQLLRFFSGGHVAFYAYWPGDKTVYIEAIASARRPQVE